MMNLPGGPTPGAPRELPPARRRPFSLPGSASARRALQNAPGGSSKNQIRRLFWSCAIQLLSA
eukprot:7803320-Alexandrium_andersonii.AAC.1